MADSGPFGGSKDYTLQAELHFIDTMGTYRPTDAEEALRGYLMALPTRHLGFGRTAMPMSDATRQMLHNRARKRLDEISLAGRI